MTKHPQPTGQLAGLIRGQKGDPMKYYIFVYWDGAGGGRRYILAGDAKEAYKRLRRFLNEHHPFRKYHIQLEQVMPA